MLNREFQEIEFRQAVQEGNYRGAQKIYHKANSSAGPLCAIWQEVYHQEMKAKRFPIALALAQAFAKTREWLVPPATAYVKRQIKKRRFDKAREWLEKYPVNYFGVSKAVAQAEEGSDLSLCLLKEAIEPHVRKSCKETLELLYQATLVCQTSPFRQGFQFSLPHHCELMLVGDIHGNRRNLNVVLAVMELERHPNRHVIFQEAIHSRGLLIDRRDLSFLEVIDILHAMVRFPHRVHFLLGNHDLNIACNRETTRSGKVLSVLLNHGLEIIFGQAVPEILEAYKLLIRQMPAVIRCGPLLITHSNPEAHELRRFKPQEILDGKAFARGDSIDCLVNGRDHSQDTVAQFLEKMDSRFSLIGHEICKNGYELSHEYQLILDSCHSRGYYLLCQPNQIEKMEDIGKGLRTVRGQ